MGAFGHTGELLLPTRWNVRSRTFGMAAGIVLAVLVAWVSFLAQGGDTNAARFASSVVLVSASFVFALYYAAGPIARLIRSDVTRTFGEERFALAYAFVGMMGVFLTTVLVPDFLLAGRVPLPTLAYAGFTAVVSVVFLLSAGSKRADKSLTLRSFRGLSSAYFWLAFAFVDMDRMIGPHRPDANPYGISLLLLVIALLVRFADAFAQKHIAGMSERTT